MVERTGLSWRLEANDSLVHLSGEITEECDFGPLVARLPPSVRLELSGIRRINSCGVREWMNFLDALERAGKQVTLERCSVPMVAQLNSITNFQGKAQVASIFAPYRCPQCEREHETLLPLDPHTRERLQAVVPCPACGAAMEFDDFPESYLDFTVH